MAHSQTYLTDQDLMEFKTVLTEKKKVFEESLRLLMDELADENQSEARELSSFPTHLADEGTEMYQREMTARLIAREQDRLEEVEQALQRIEDGTFGICLATGQPISKERLRATPWAKFSMEYAKQTQAE